MMAISRRRSLRIIPAQWVLAIVGSALVLVSTLVTGYFAYQAQNSIDDLHAAIGSKMSELAESERSSASSSLISTLANIQNNTIELISDPRVRAASQDANDLTEFESIQELAFAADRWRELPTLAALTSLLKKARTDVAAVEQIANLTRGLETARFSRVVRLQKEIEKHEAQVRDLQRARNRDILIGLV